jgi:hypothetical protein
MPCIILQGMRETYPDIGTNGSDSRRLAHLYLLVLAPMPMRLRLLLHRTVKKPSSYQITLCGKGVVESALLRPRCIGCDFPGSGPLARGS